jgi:hypothetical protein
MRTLRLTQHCLSAILAIAASLSPAAGAQNQTGTIRVLVQSQGTSDPIAGAQVTMIGASAVVAGVLTASFNASALTDATGVALFDKVPLARYGIRAQREGYIGLAGASTSPTPTREATTTILANSPSTTVTLTLAVAGSISGRIKSAQGTSLPATRISASVLGYRDGRPTLLVGPNVQPDGQGNYRLSPLGPGEYYIKVESQSSPSIHGVTVFYPGVTELEEAVLVPVLTDQEVVGVDFEMPRVQPFKVSGRILSFPPPPLAANGLPAPNGLLGFTVVPADRPELGNTPLISNASGGTNGEFEINLPAGDWNIFPVIPINSTGTARGQGVPAYATGHARVLVTDRNIENVTITIGSSDMKVRVTDAPNGASISRISLLPRGNIPSPLISHLRATQPLNANGEIEFKAVPQGEYRLLVPQQPNSYVADLRVGTKSIYEDGIIKVDLGPMEPVEIVLRDGGGTVQGNLTMPNIVDGPDAASRRVVLVPDVALRRGNSVFYRVAQNFTRSFSFRGVPPGDYKVFAFQNLPFGGAEQDEKFMTKYERFGVPVKVMDGQTSNVAVEWIPKD